MSWRDAWAARLDAMADLNPADIGPIQRAPGNWWNNRMTALTLNEHKLLLRLNRDGMQPYGDNEGPALDHLVELGLVRVFEIYVDNGVDFRWGNLGDGDQDLSLAYNMHRAVSLTDRGRKEVLT